MIPKIIHQTISHKNNLHETLKKNIQKIKDLNPGWEYCLYDDQDRQDFIAKSYGTDTLEIYNKINPNYGQAQADFFRYLLIYAVGGVYLDVKSTCSVALDEIISDDDEYILSHWNNDVGGTRERWGAHPELIDLVPKGEYQLWHIISRPGHPFLKAVISRVTSNIKNYAPYNYGVGRVGVLRTTGPIPYTLAIEKIRSDHRYRMVEAEKIGLVPSVFDDSGTQGNKHQNIYGRKHYSRLNEPVVGVEQKIESKIAEKKFTKLNLKSKTNIEIFCNENVKSLVMVASHERSGTHFAMNSIGFNSLYHVRPHLNLDLEPLGAMINFTNPNALQEFFTILNEMKCSNIMKSHFPIEYFLNDGIFVFPENLKIIYIYRDPVDTIISYKNFIDHFNKNNHEGPKSDNFLDFAKASPEGRMMRYQLYQKKTIIERWENHVSGWLKAADTQPNILPINYDDLNEKYDMAVNKILKFIGVAKKEKAIRPGKINNTVHIPEDTKPSTEERAQLAKLIKENLSDKRLKDLVLSK
jgi:mannosyltransferase OCH1-like enzyme